jgi:hypothetical protein
MGEAEVSENSNEARAVTLEELARDMAEMTAENARLSERLAQIEARRGVDGRPSRPTGTPTRSEGSEGDRPVSRRGALLALGGAAAGGVGLALASSIMSAEPAAATQDAAVLAGESNTATDTTEVITSSGSGVYGISGASSAISSSDAGVFGDSSTAFGVLGTASGADGVHGETTHAGSSGVFGLDTSSGDGGYGVSARSTNGCGVSGLADLPASSTVPSGVGVYGASASGSGIVGVASAPSGLSAGLLCGVLGDTDGDGTIGVTGLSLNGTGVYGETQGDDAYGVFGDDESSGGGIGVYGSSNVGRGVAGESTSGIGVFAHTESGTALFVNGPVSFTTSGVATVAAHTTKVTVTLAGVTTASLILATAQAIAAKVAVEAAVPGSGSFTITLTKAPTVALPVAWFVLAAA